MPVPALVAAELFERVQRRLRANQQGALRSTTHPYLLRGLVSCGVCRLSCTGCARWTEATGRDYRYYRCRGKLTAVSTGRAARCGARFIPARPTGRRSSGTTSARCSSSRPWSPRRWSGPSSGAWVPEELRRRQATLRHVRAGVARQRQRLLDAYLAEAIDLATFERRDRDLREREDELGARERELAAQGERSVEVAAIARSAARVCAAPRRPGAGDLRAAPAAGGVARRPGRRDRRRRGDPLRGAHDGGQHPHPVLSLADGLLPGRTGGSTPARPGRDPAASPRGRPTTATAPWAGGCGPGPVRPGRG